MRVMRPTTAEKPWPTHQVRAMERRTEVQRGERTATADVWVGRTVVVDLRVRLWWRLILAPWQFLVVSGDAVVFGFALRGRIMGKRVVRRSDGLVKP